MSETKVFSCEFNEIFKNMFFNRIHPVAAFDPPPVTTHGQYVLQVTRYNRENNLMK